MTMTYHFVEEGEPTHTLVPRWMNVALPPRCQCMDCFVPTPICMGLFLCSYWLVRFDSWVRNSHIILDKIIYNPF